MRTLVSILSITLLAIGSQLIYQNILLGSIKPVSKDNIGIDLFEITSVKDAYNGKTPPGATGPYQVITAIAHGRLDPQSPRNAQIVDIDLAPINENGMVVYKTNVVILRPTSANNGKRILFYDVVNRGRKIIHNTNLGGGNIDTAISEDVEPSPTLPSLLHYGYTIVWSGWHGNIQLSGSGINQLVGTDFPIAKYPDGKVITGRVREEYIPDVSPDPFDHAPSGRVYHIPLSYSPASLEDLSGATLTARQSWLNTDGLQDYNVSSVPVKNWHYTNLPDGKNAATFTPPDYVWDATGKKIPPDEGTIYQFVYRAKDPKVNGIGFAAVRDIVDFLKNKNYDNQGNANPLNDFKLAICAREIDCDPNPKTNFDVVLAHGVSQSGRFLRDFLYQGFNQTNAGDRVFDGIATIIAGARRTWTNYRFSQTGRWSKQHEDHFMPGDQFPFAYNVFNDPNSNKSDGLLKACLQTDTCPKIMQIDGSFEWWGGRASLVVTDGGGRDLVLPDNVRYYLIPGTSHGGGRGLSSGSFSLPSPKGLCQMPASPVHSLPFYRALTFALAQWVSKNITPPPSRYPTVAAGTLVSPDRVQFPPIDEISVPIGKNALPTPLSITFSARHNTLFSTDYSSAEPVVDLSKPYQILVPAVNQDGNETSGIPVPEVSVPLASYTGWNLRREGHAKAELCAGEGGAIPFAINRKSRSPSDIRSSLDDLYTSRSDYQSKVDKAVSSLLDGGYILPLDAEQYRRKAKKISEHLIPLP